MNSDRDISQWDARLKEQLERSFHNYHKQRIDLSIARDNKIFNWTGETIIVEEVSSSNANATVRILFDDADPLELKENIVIKSIFNRVYLTNTIQANEWLDVIYGINFEYKKKVSGGGLMYYDRGDIGAYDWSLVDFTTDGVMRDLDLSAIIPPGTALVKLALSAKENAGNKYLQFRTNGNVNLVNIEGRTTPGANIQHSSAILVAPDANGVIEYRIENAVWNVLYLVVTGWFV